MASQLTALRMLAGVKAGSVTNGRQAARALGHENCLSGPATAAYLAAQELVQDAVPPAGAEGFTVADVHGDVL